MSHRALRPELGSPLDISDLNSDTAAASPSYRRASSILEDAVHDVRHEVPQDLPDDKHCMAPGQLYSTGSGQLYHSGRIVVALVGLPARGKT